MESSPSPQAPEQEGSLYYLEKTEEQREECRKKYFLEWHKNFTPTEKEIFITLKDGRYQRLIFHAPLELRENEIEHLKNFRQYLKDKGLHIPPGYDDDTRLILRYLQGLSWNYEKTHISVTEHCLWKQKTFPMQMSSFEPYLNEGFMYIYKRDKVGRPIIILDVQKVLNSNVYSASVIFCQVDLNNIIMMSEFLMSFMLEELMIPGRIENLTSIVDLQNVGLSQIPKNLLQGVVTSMARNYRGRLNKTHIINMPLVMRTLFALASKWMDEFTLQKQCVCGKNFQEEILKTIGPENLEQKFGGILPNKTKNFFPPDMK